MRSYENSEKNKIFLRQYELLQQILSGEIFLYNIDDLENIIVDNNKYNKKIINIIIEENRHGKAPKYKSIIDNIHISRPIVGKCIRYLREKELIITPTLFQFGELTKEINNYKYEFNCPMNVKHILKSMKGKKGNSYKKRFKNFRDNFRVGIFCLALFYDEDGPVYKQCFPQSKLNFNKKKI